MYNAMGFSIQPTSKLLLITTINAKILTFKTEDLKFDGECVTSLDVLFYQQASLLYGQKELATS